MKINGNALTEKGVLKAGARKAVADYVNANLAEVISAASRVEGKNTYVFEISDTAGNTVYVNFDFTVSAMSAADRAEKKTGTKKKAAVAETFDVAD